MFDDEVLEKEKADQLKSTIQTFLQLFDEGDIEKAKRLSIFSAYVLEVLFLFESSMTPNQKHRFRQTLGSYVWAAFDELEILKSKEADSLDQFLENRLKVGFFDFWRLLSEACCGIDTSKDEYRSLFRWVLTQLLSCDFICLYYLSLLFSRQ